MKEFSDLHFIISGGFTQRSGHYKLTTVIDPKESSVNSRHFEHSGQPLDRAFPDSLDEDTSVNAAVQDEQNVPQRSPAKYPLAQTPRFTPLEDFQAAQNTLNRCSARKSWTPFRRISIRQNHWQTFAASWLAPPAACMKPGWKR